MNTINDLPNLLIDQGVTNHIQQKQDIAENFNTSDTSEKGVSDTVELSEMAKEIVSLVEKGFDSDKSMNQYGVELLQGEEETMVREMGRLPQDIGSHVWQALQSYLDNAGEKTAATLRSLKNENPSSLSGIPETANAADVGINSGAVEDGAADEVDVFLSKRGLYPTFT